MLRHEFRRRSHVDQYLAVKDTHTAGAESSVLWRKVIHHQFVSFEEIIDGCRV